MINEGEKQLKEHTCTSHKCTSGIGLGFGIGKVMQGQESGYLTFTKTETKNS